MNDHPDTDPAPTEAAPGHRRLPGDLWSILATPFDAHGGLDHVSMRRQVAFVRDAGASGVVALGVFGEASSLTLAEQRDVVTTVVGAGSGLPVVLGVGARSTAVAVEQASNGVDATGDQAPEAIMVMIPSAQPDAVVAHMEAVHRATGAPIVLQDYPASSGVRIGAAALAEVVARCPFVCAVKAEAAPTPPAIADLAARAGVPSFGGLGGVGLLDELAAGSAGAMTGFSHPEGLRAILDAFAADGFTAARTVWEPWLPLATFEAQGPLALALRKMLLHRRGVLDHPTVRPPAPTLPAPMLPLVEHHLSAAPTTPAGGAGTT